MLKEADQQDIDLDDDLVAAANKFCYKLISERNLRKQRDLFENSISSCNHDEVDKLNGLLDKATELGVDT